jgi:hypothetical protein
MIPATYPHHSSRRRIFRVDYYRASDESTAERRQDRHGRPEVDAKVKADTRMCTQVSCEGNCARAVGKKDRERKEGRKKVKEKRAKRCFAPMRRLFLSRITAAWARILQQPASVIATLRATTLPPEQQKRCHWLPKGRPSAAALLSVAGWPWRARVCLYVCVYW